MTAPSAPGERPTCGTCPYWIRGYRSARDPFEWTTVHVVRFAGGSPPDIRTEIMSGDCRRHSARPPVIEDGDAFGRTHAQEWCGDHPDFPAYLAARPPLPTAETHEDRHG